ncbi:MAG: hypothetical protein ACTHZX_04340 [Microbacterium sp.]
MLRESQTAVLERGVTSETGAFVTEPFEVAWAIEARWFVHFLESSQARVALRTEISADGLTWVPHEDDVLVVPMQGVASVPVRDFGHWLRLSVVSEGGAPVPLTRVSLALKG